MTAKCPKFPFLAMPEELDDHMSIHTSTRPNLTSRLTTAATATCSEKEGGQRIEKEKKMCIICEKQLALSSTANI